MKLVIIPKEDITIITKKSNKDFIASLIKEFRPHERKNLKFASTSNHFVIQTTAYNKSCTSIIVNGIIHDNNPGNSICIAITAKDSYLLYFAVFWYSVHVLIFFTLLYFSIVTNSFKFFFFIPLFNIFAGYCLTTVTIQYAMDRIIRNIQRAAR